MRRKLFVKPELQLKYVLITVVLVIISGIFTYFIMNYKLTTSPFTENLSYGEIMALKKDIIVSFIEIMLILAFVVTIQSIILFHRLIGPIYALEKIIEIMKSGRIGGKIKLRKRDQLKELASLLEELGNNYSMWIKEDRERIEKIKQQLESLKNNIPSDKYENILEELNKITSKFNIESGK